MGRMLRGYFQRGWLVIVDGRLMAAFVEGMEAAAREMESGLEQEVGIQPEYVKVVPGLVFVEERP
jgi:hypothetical protein